MTDKYYKIYLRAEEGEDIHITKTGEDEFKVLKPDSSHERAEYSIKMNTKEVLDILEGHLQELVY